MRLIRVYVLAAVLVTGALGAGRADADGLIDEFRLGVYDHDVSFLGHQKEKGADIGAELLFEPLAFLWEPRPVIGVLGNSAGQTSQAYFGLTWTWDFAHALLLRDDGLFLEGTLGGGVNNGKIDVTDPIEAEHRKSLGSNVLFREDVDIGYRLNRAWSVALSYNHISNADLASRNEGINDVGIRVGVKF